jgi:hypothetical protein
MKLQKNLITRALLCTHLILLGGYAAAMNPVAQSMPLAVVPVAKTAQEAVKKGVGAECMDHVKSVGHGIAHATSFLFKKGSQLWNKHGRAWHIEAAAIAVIAYALYNYYGVIKAIEKKYKSSRNNNDNLERLSIWSMNKWKNHVAIILDQNTVLNSLRSEQSKAQLSDDEIIGYIENEREELDKDILYLENKFVTYFNLPDWMPMIGGDHGITKRYEDIVRRHGLADVGDLDWSEAQFAAIDIDMKNMCDNNWYHYALCKINFGSAAKVWWKLKKLRMRLDALNHLFVPVSQGQSNTPFNNRQANAVDARVRTQQRHRQF